MSISSLLKKTAVATLLLLSFNSTAHNVTNILPTHTVKVSYAMGINENKAYSDATILAANTTKNLDLGGTYVSIVESVLVHSRTTIVFDRNTQHFHATVEYYKTANSINLVSKLVIDGDVVVTHNALKFININKGEKVLPDNKSLIIDLADNNLVIKDLVKNESTTYYKVA